MFLGYSTSKSAYRCLDLSHNRLYFSRHVRFVENKFLFQVPPPQSSSAPAIVDPPGNSPTSLSFSSPYNMSMLPQVPPSVAHSPLSSSSSHTPEDSSVQTPHATTSSSTSHSTDTTSSSPSISSDSSSSAETTQSEPVTTNNRPARNRVPNPKYYNSSFVNYTTVHPLAPSLEPSSVTQALKDPNWRQAMASEFDALIQNGT